MKLAAALVGSRRLTEDLRSASAGVGRSQKAILRFSDRQTFDVPVKDGDLRTAPFKGGPALARVAPRTPGIAGWCLHGSAAHKPAHPADVPARFRAGFAHR
jgi:hypothetical protein